MADFSPLSVQCVKALNDKMNDKRKAAATEIEKMTKEFITVDNKAQIVKLLRVLGEDFVKSNTSNVRKGGLMGLAAVAIGLGKEIGSFTNELVTPTIACFSDPDSKVRFFACECLFNIVKVARNQILPLFGNIFVSMIGVVSDLDHNVRLGSDLLDRTLKDIVTESPDFNAEDFVIILKNQMFSKNPFIRQFFLGWLQTLDNIAEQTLLVHMSEFVDPLFEILSDPKPDIYTLCENIMGTLLTKVKASPDRVNYGKMINVLIAHSKSNHVRLQIMAVHWIHEFVNLSGRDIIPHAGGILLAILPNLALDDEQRRAMTPIDYKTGKDLCDKVNSDLMHLIEKNGEDDNVEGITDLELTDILDVLTKLLQWGKVETKLACLRWFYHLLKVCPKSMNNHVDIIFPVLLKTLSDSSDEVLILTLQVLSEICNPSSNQTKPLVGGVHFKQFILGLLTLFRANKNLLQSRGSFILRHLCVSLNAEDVYRCISEFLVEEKDLNFAHRMVETLSTILLTSVELFELRSKLKDLSSKESCELFCCLYRTWCHSPIATIALCFQSSCYKHAGTLIEIISACEITVEILIELDKLVQLIESPIFTYIRMQLLDTKRNTDLIYAFYALLMVLPQSRSFVILKERLSCLPPLSISSEFKSMKTSNCKKFIEEIDFDSLAEHYIKVQEQHECQNRAAKKNELLAKGVANIP